MRVDPVPHPSPPRSPLRGGGGGPLATPSPPDAQRQRVGRVGVGAVPQAAKVATDFEALFIGQLLRAAHGAKLADDPLAGHDDAFRDQQDTQLARTLAKASPLGVAKLLAARP